MAFSYTILDESNAIGRKKQVLASFTNGASDTGGAISTGLTTVLHVNITKVGDAISTGAPAYSASAGVVTIKTDADVDGTVEIIGY